MTAYNDTAYLLDSIEIGIGSYIMKPVDYHKLFSVIDAAIADISLKKQFRESEDRFRRALTDAPLPIAIYAEDGEILQLNKVWTELTGYTRTDIPTIAEWIKRTRPLYDHAGGRLDLGRAFERNERSHLGEYVVITKSGARLTWDFSSAPLGTLLDGRRLVISMAVDVTERTGPRKNFRKTNNSFEAQRIAHLGSWEWDFAVDRVSWIEKPR